MARVPINFKTGEVKREQELVVGIDLGTTNSLIASTHNGIPSILKNQDGKRLCVPSVVFLPPEGGSIVGNAAQTQLTLKPESTIYSAKRLLGKSFNDLKDKKKYFGYNLDDSASENSVRVMANGISYSPVELSAMILRHLKSEAEKSTKAVIEKAVITVPAYFNDSQRQATRDAGRLAGLDVLRIINEPTAASLAYGLGLDREKSSLVAVYDLGGGTFDLTILRIEDGIFDVLATRGDTYLGGDDFDMAVVSFWSGKYGFPVPDRPAERNSLRLEAEKIRIALNNSDSASTHWNGRILELNRYEFESCSSDLVDKTLDCCKLALADSGLSSQDLDEVILVGGSTRMYLIQDAVQKYFGKKGHIELDPDEAVALGAAIQADILSGRRKDMLLLDVNPLSLGIETMGGIMDVVIPRNSKLPAHQARNYTTHKDGQTQLKISVYQGERDLVEHNRKLGEFILKNIPPMPAGLPKIEVSFKVDSDGILHVKAKELRSGTVQEIQIRSQFTLSPEEVNAMLKSALEHAEEDMQYKAITDTINEAENVILHTNRFIIQNAEWLAETEIHELKKFVDLLKGAILSKNKISIEKTMAYLNQYAEPLAHKAMDLSVQHALHGKKI